MGINPSSSPLKVLLRNAVLKFETLLGWGIIDENMRVFGLKINKLKLMNTNNKDISITSYYLCFSYTTATSRLTMYWRYMSLTRTRPLTGSLMSSWTRGL
jgi:hypothetical protein